MSENAAEPVATTQKFTAVCMGKVKVMDAEGFPQAREIALKEMNIRPMHERFLAVLPGTPYGENPKQWNTEE